MRMTQDMDDDEKGKLFVGGLSWETTQENLQRYFARYGDVIDCVVMKNNESGRSRGFGFVTFADPGNVTHVLQSGPHNLDGRTIDPKPCNPRTLQKPKKGGGYPKVFLGGLPSNVTETDLRVFFGRYGKVMEVVIMYDQEKKKSRGFGFLSFEDEASVERVTNEHYINLNGKQVEIKKAEPRDGNAANKINSGAETNQWGPPQGAPMGMLQGPNGQINAPPLNIAMGAPNMMQGYQGWGTSPQQQSFGYGTPNAPGSYQGWGAPPGPQGPPPHQWGNNYATQQTQGYGSYDMYNSTTGPSGASGGGNWNAWNMPQNSAGTGGSVADRFLAGDMYPRTQSGPGGPSGTGPTAGMPPGGPANSASKPSSDYGGYGSGYGLLGNYTNDHTTSYGTRTTYGNEATSQPPYAVPQPQDEFLKQY
ncbi:heterogeneous nuclear ribonucleoprotein 27C isoform X1 [Lutzomyia longipalpis]|nr:heterogeneous nuclear ribonucleoprotein 27C isoform X1 [Lutzomyia longipalpis]